MNTVTCLPIGKTGRQATATCIIEDRQPHTCMHPPSHVDHPSLLTACAHTYTPEAAQPGSTTAMRPREELFAAISEQEGKGQRAFVLMVWNTAFFHPLLSL